MTRLRPATLASVGALLAVACTSAGRTTSSPAAPAGPAGTIIVANQQSRSATLVTIPGGATRHVEVGTGPHEAMASLDGRWGIVTIYGNQAERGNRLAIVDLASGTLVKHVGLAGHERPHGVVPIPGAGRRVVVTSETSQRLLVVDLDRDTVLAAIPTGAAGSHMVAVTRDGTRAFTANVGSGSMSEIDLVAMTLVRQLPIAPVSEGIAAMPDGREVWVGSNQLRTISVVDVAQGKVVATITGVGVPYRLAFSPDGRTVAVADPESGVHLVDVATRAVQGSVTGLGSTRGVIWSADGRTVFATMVGEAGAGTVVEIDAATRSARATHAVQVAPDGVGFAAKEN